MGHNGGLVPDAIVLVEVELEVARGQGHYCPLGQHPNEVSPGTDLGSSTKVCAAPQRPIQFKTLGFGEDSRVEPARPPAHHDGFSLGNSDALKNQLFEHIA